MAVLLFSWPRSRVAHLSSKQGYKYKVAALSGHQSTCCNNYLFLFLYLKASFMLHSKETEKKEASPDRQGKVLLYRCGNIYYSHQH